jgi:hypothetical protein
MEQTAACTRYFGQAAAWVYPRKMQNLLIRDSVAADVPAITAIYAHWVINGLASFEIEAPDVAEMARRRDAVTGAGFPYVVAAGPDGVRGYAYVGAYRFLNQEDGLLAATVAGRITFLAREGFAPAKVPGSAHQAPLSSASSLEQAFQPQ